MVTTLYLLPTTHKLEIYLSIFLSILSVSLLAFAGVFWLSLGADRLRRLLFFLIAFSAGALLGDVFLHLLPELAEDGGLDLKAGLSVLAGIFVFLILESIVCWRHCHVPTSHQHIHPVGITNLAGDAMHNFIDGMLIAGSFLVSFPLGLATTLAVILHEIPQEIGDFGVLLHAGFSRKRALFFNFFSALSAFLGALLVVWLGAFESFLDFTIALTIGGFIYVACADLIPEIHKECRPKHSALQLIAFLAGIGVMAILLLIE